MSLTPALANTRGQNRRVLSPTIMQKGRVDSLLEGGFLVRRIQIQCDSYSNESDKVMSPINSSRSGRHNRPGT